MRPSLRNLVVAMACLIGAGNFVSAAGAQTLAKNIPTFVYEGSGCTGAAKLPQFQALIGRPVDGAADFLDYTSSWSNLVSETNWALGCWQGKVNNLSLAVPMVVAQNDGSPIHELAAGNFNTYYTQIAKSLVSHGFANAYLRVGWEFNGGWYGWYAGNAPALWIQGYQQIVNAMRAVPGANFKFVWNPALFQQGIYPDQVYPGDSYVDVIATDAYNASWAPNYTVPASMWDSVENDNWGVAQVVAFAKTHKKPVAFPEWGTGTRPDGHGGGDDPLFLTNMASIMAANNVAYQSYWDYNAGDYNSAISDGENIKAAASFINYYGWLPSGETSTVPVIKNLGRILKTYALPYTPAPFAVTCNGCSTQVLQNAPNHYEVLVWSAAAMPNAVVSWGTKAANASLYDPNVGPTAIKALGAVSGATVALAAGKPLIVAVQR